MPALVAFLLLALLGVAGCDRPAYEQCEAVCIRYAELMHWERFADEAEGKPDDEVAALRSRFEADWEQIASRESDPGKANCITDCRRSGDSELVACMERAESADDARACID